MYRYRMKDVDCKQKAPFICQYNQGKKMNVVYDTVKMQNTYQNIVFSNCVNPESHLG
jgi:hypothetical protein